MAAPSEKTIKNLDGQWVVNKPLSDDFDQILQLQSISWLIRKAISYATITLHVNHYTDADSALHIDVASIITGGIKTTTEKRTLDWTYRDHQDNIFGAVKGKSRLTRLREIQDDDWIKEGWEDSEGEFLQTFVESKDGGWTAHQVWGFESVKDERRYSRRIIVRKGEKVRKARMVYDYLGPVPSAAKEEDGLAYEE